MEDFIAFQDPNLWSSMFTISEGRRVTFYRNRPFYEEIRMRRPTNIPKTIIIKLKAWIYQHEILPRLMWLLLINEVATTTVEAMARKVGGYLKRWLRFQLSSCTTIIYINWIRVSSVVAECRLAMTSNDSAHNSIFRPGIQTRTGRRWSAKT